jgi:hypothetical protein
MAEQQPDPTPVQQTPGAGSGFVVPRHAQHNFANRTGQVAPHSQGANMPDNDTIVAENPKDTRNGTTRVRSFRLTATVPPEDTLRAAATQALERRLQLGAVQLHSIGAWALAAEFLEEIGSDHDNLSAILDLLDEYHHRLPPCGPLLGWEIADRVLRDASK